MLVMTASISCPFFRPHWVFDPSRPRNIGHVHQTINAILDLDEGTKIGSGF